MNASFSAPGNDLSKIEESRQSNERRPRSASNELRGHATASTVLNDLIDLVAPSPWGAHSGRSSCDRARHAEQASRALYTPEERLRRDASPWTIVQGVLAPLQFLIFAVSLGLVVRYLLTGRGYEVATASIVVKTAALYTIMITGAIWEKQVFGQWLFARSFFWEDAFSMLVIGLQTAYIAALLAGWGSARQQMMVAVAAYATYVINATQFVLKLRAARLEGQSRPVLPAGPMGNAA